MDHSEAIRLQAAEKYVLGELPQEVRDSFEEHFFDCGECAVDVRAMAAFVEAGRQVLRTEPGEVAATRTGESRGGWLFWLRPAFAVPALLILLAVVGYQNLITFPKLRSGEVADKAHVFNSFSLVAANLRSERGEGEVKVQVHKNEMFALDFDFIPAQKFDHYLCQLQDEAGHEMLQVGIPAEKDHREVHLLVPKELARTGEYNVVIVGDPGAKGQWVKGNEVSRLNFQVEILP